MVTTRRALLGSAMLGAAAGTGRVLAAPAPPVPATPVPATSGGATSGPGLQHQAERSRRFYGAAIDDAILHKDAAYMAHVPQECGMVVGESSFKWAAVRPAADKFDYTAAEALMSFATRRRLRVRGHALVWHEANPDWLLDALTAQTGEKLLTTHIATVVKHFRNRLVHWDVVNEALRLADNKPGGLRETPWLLALGPRYIDMAFHAAAEADPGALRVLNEYGVDYAWDEDERKRGALLELLAGLKARNVPVEAVGLQAHLDAAVQQLDQKILARFCDDIASLGLRIIVTEMDVRDNRLPADIAGRDAAVAAHGRAYLDAVLASKAVLGVLTWGLSDRRSWLNDKMPRQDGLPQRPLPLDTELNRKPLWSAIGGAFAAAPARV